MDTTTLKEKVLKYGLLIKMSTPAVTSAQCATIGAANVGILITGICVTITTVATATVVPVVGHRLTEPKTLSSAHTGEHNTNRECSLLQEHTFRN